MQARRFLSNVLLIVVVVIQTGCEGNEPMNLPPPLKPAIEKARVLDGSEDAGPDLFDLVDTWNELGYRKQAFAKFREDLRHSQSCLIVEFGAASDPDYYFLAFIDSQDTSSALFCRTDEHGSLVYGKETLKSPRIASGVLRDSDFWELQSDTGHAPEDGEGLFFTGIEGGKSRVVCTYGPFFIGAGGPVHAEFVQRIKGIRLLMDKLVTLCPDEIVRDQLDGINW